LRDKFDIYQRLCEPGDSLLQEYAKEGRRPEPLKEANYLLKLEHDWWSQQWFYITHGTKFSWDSFGAKREDVLAIHLLAEIALKLRLGNEYIGGEIQRINHLVESKNKKKRVEAKVAIQELRLRRVSMQNNALDCMNFFGRHLLEKHHKDRHILNELVKATNQFIDSRKPFNELRDKINAPLDAGIKESSQVVDLTPQP